MTGVALCRADDFPESRVRGESKAGSVTVTPAVAKLLMLELEVPLNTTPTKIV